MGIYDAANENIIRRDIIHHWTNSGNIPALRARSHVSWQSFAVLPGAEFDYPDMGREDPTEMVIGRRGTFNSSALQIREDIFHAVADGRVRLLTWGWAEYSDYLVGTPRHRTEFCHEIGVSSMISPLSTNRISLSAGEFLRLLPG
jgi:hypothetical protein